MVFKLPGKSSIRYGGNKAMRVVRKTRPQGFTLVEILVAALLLSGSLIVIMKLWSVSRSITEGSRNTAEYYTIARQETERARTSSDKQFLTSATATTIGPRTGFAFIFQNSSATYTLPLTVTTNYDQNGLPVSSGGYYQAVSEYRRIMTGTEADPNKQLGVQKVDIYVLPRATGDKQVYETSMFFTEVGL